jgi:hypothetical protein
MGGWGRSKEDRWGRSGEEWLWVCWCVVTEGSCLREWASTVIIYIYSTAKQMNIIVRQPVRSGGPWNGGKIGEDVGGLWVVEVGTVEKILSGCCGNRIVQLKVRDLLLLGLGLAWS